MMKKPSSTIHSSAIRGTASGVFFMALFGTLWAYTGIMGLQELAAPLWLAAAVAVGIVLFIGGASLIRASRKIKDQSEVTDARPGKRIAIRFNIIFAAEGAAIAIAVAVCNAAGRTALIPIVTALIVGIHFFPLASLFRVKFYHLTGALLCMLALAALLFLPVEARLGAAHINAYMSVVGLGSALILWGTGTAIWFRGRRLLTISRL
ncbi:putative membrane protein [Paenibacillus rhizosphaerae]|uniref:Putative membrane protein n=1 Tax=Paenibacillus rhizosphaerae TaxID=297318 RepID=A0A839TFH0_9BACL|nr:hypothetical protein [Paenibacillus rhizosphaerae]MBB3125545.1 putative membrane protein [Paenibacillus rhizosphaerae]